MVVVGEVGSNGQGNSGAVYVDETAFVACVAVNILPFMQVLFKVEGVFTVRNADHRNNIGLAVGVVQRAAYDHHRVRGYSVSVAKVLSLRRMESWLSSASS